MCINMGVTCHIGLSLSNVYAAAIMTSENCLDEKHYKIKE